MATETLTALPIQRTRLLDLLHSYPRIQHAFFYEEVTRHVNTRSWTAVLGALSARERCAYFFYEMYARLNAMGLVSGQEFELPLTQSDLGDLLGMSVVHFNRTLRRLKDEGLLTWDAGRVHPTLIPGAASAVSWRFPERSRTVRQAPGPVATGAAAPTKAAATPCSLSPSRSGSMTYPAVEAYIRL